MWNMVLRFCVSKVTCMLNCKTFPPVECIEVFLTLFICGFVLVNEITGTVRLQLWVLNCKSLCIVLVRTSYFMPSVQLSNQMQKGSLDILCRPPFFWYHHKMEMKSCLSIFFCFPWPLLVELYVCDRVAICPTKIGTVLYRMATISLLTFHNEQMRKISRSELCSKKLCGRYSTTRMETPNTRDASGYPMVFYWSTK
jgi:hypothetical protein